MWQLSVTIHSQIESMIHELRRPVSYVERDAHCRESVSAGVRLSEQHQTSGIRFARKRIFASRSVKDAARSRVTSAFTTVLQSPERSHIFSMPGLHWDFEKSLIGIAKSTERPHPRFYCVERDPAIFLAALAKRPKKSGKHHLWAVDPNTVRCSYLSRYRMGKAEDMLGTSDATFDAAWLDFCGPLSVNRLALLEQFWEKTPLLALTVMKGRYDAQFRELVRARGSLLGLLRERMPEPCDVYEYGDGAAMLQIIWRRESVA